jgi:hypothetical protein
MHDKQSFSLRLPLSVSHSFPFWTTTVSLISRKLVKSQEEAAFLDSRKDYQVRCQTIFFYVMLRMFTSLTNSFVYLICSYRILHENLPIDSWNPVVRIRFVFLACFALFVSQEYCCHSFFLMRRLICRFVSTGQRSYSAPVNHESHKNGCNCVTGIPETLPRTNSEMSQSTSGVSFLSALHIEFVGPDETRL